MDINKSSGDQYSYLFKREENTGDAHNITRTTKVQSSVTTRLTRGASRKADSVKSTEVDYKNISDSSMSQSTETYNREVESHLKQDMSGDFKEISYPVYDKTDYPEDENTPPYLNKAELRRARSDGDLLNSEMNAKSESSQGMPFLEKKVHFTSTKSVPSNSQEEQTETYFDKIFYNSDERNKRSRSCEKLDWKTPHIDVRRKVKLLSQKKESHRSKSADYHVPRKGILKTKRITETNTIRVSGTIPTGQDMEKQEASTVGTSESNEEEKMDYSTSSITTSTQSQESKEKMFKLPERYHVQQDIELESETKPRSMIFTRKWKSEPTLAFQNAQKRSRSMERLPSEREPKLSSFKIDLIKPIDIKPLKPAYSTDDLPFETAIRNQVNFQLKPQKWKSNPELASSDKLHQQNHPKEFEPKIVRAMPVHVHPLHKPTPVKETSSKVIEVKDASMQFTSVQDTSSKATQVFFESPTKHIPAKQSYKYTQTKSVGTDTGYKLTVPEPVVVEFKKSEINKETPKVRRLQTEPRIGEFDLSKVEKIKEKKDPSKREMSERLVVEYAPESEKPIPKEPERVSMETCEEHATEVKLRKRASESQKEQRVIQVGRIEEIDLDLAQRETETVRLLVTLN